MWIYILCEYFFHIYHTSSFGYHHHWDYVIVFFIIVMSNIIHRIYPKETVNYMSQVTVKKCVCAFAGSYSLLISCFNESWKHIVAFPLQQCIDSIKSNVHYIYIFFLDCTYNMVDDNQNDNAKI